MKPSFPAQTWVFYNLKKKLWVQFMGIGYTWLIFFSTILTREANSVTSCLLSCTPVPFWKRVYSKRKKNCSKGMGHPGVFREGEVLWQVQDFREKFWSKFRISLYILYIFTSPSAQDREVSQLRETFSPKSPSRMTPERRINSFSYR